MTTMEIEHSSEVLAGGRVHSGIAWAHLRWVRDYHGDQAVKELVAPVPQEGWISFESLIALDRAIERKFGRGRRGFLRELGRYSAHLNLSDPRDGFRGEAIHDFFYRAALLHARFQDFGTAAYEELDPTSGRMVHAAYPCFSPLYCASAIGYYEQALIIQHAIPTRVEETSCQCNGETTCTFEMRWA